MFCTGCGSRLDAGQKFCTRCGAAAISAEPVEPMTRGYGHPGPSELPRTDERPAASPLPPGVPVGSYGPLPMESTGTRITSRTSLMLMAAVLVVVLAGGGGLWAWLRSGGSSADHEWNVTSFSDHPSLKWQDTVTEVSDIGCTTESSSDDGSPASCMVTVNSVGKDMVVVGISSESNDELVGLDRTSGAKKWQTVLTGTPTCVSRNGTLWCLIDHTSYDDTGDSSSAPPTLMTIDRKSGKPRGEVAVPGATDEALFLANDDDAVYTMGSQSTDDTDSTITVSRIDSKAKVSWQKVLNVTTGDQWSGGLGIRHVGLINDGTLYLPGVEFGGQQVALKVSDGSKVKAESGHVVALVNGVVVAQHGASGLQIGKTLVGQSNLLSLPAYDGSSSEPAFATSGAGDSVADASLPVSVLNVKKPSTPLFELRGYRPLALCDGTIYAVSSVNSSSSQASATASVEALDPTSGDVRWQKVLPASDAWCTEGGVVVGSGRQLTKLSKKDGDTAWSVVTAAGTSYGLYGGLVVQPGEQDGVVGISEDGQSFTYIY